MNTADNMDTTADAVQKAVRPVTFNFNLRIPIVDKSLKLIQLFHTVKNYATNFWGFVEFFEILASVIRFLLSELAFVKSFYEYIINSNRFALC